MATAVSIQGDSNRTSRIINVAVLSREQEGILITAHYVRVACHEVTLVTLLGDAEFNVV